MTGETILGALCENISLLIGLPPFARKRNGNDFLWEASLRTLMLRSDIHSSSQTGHRRGATLSAHFICDDLGPVSKSAFRSLLLPTLGAELILYSRCDAVAVGEAPILGMAVSSFIEALAPDREKRKKPKPGRKWREKGNTNESLVDSEPLTTVIGF